MWAGQTPVNCKARPTLIIMGKSLFRAFNICECCKGLVKKRYWKNKKNINPKLCRYCKKYINKLRKDGDD